MGGGNKNVLAGKILKNQLAEGGRRLLGTKEYFALESQIIGENECVHDLFLS